MKPSGPERPKSQYPWLLPTLVVVAVCALVWAIASTVAAGRFL